MLIQNSDRHPNDTDPERLQKVLQQLLEQIAIRDQKIAWIKAEKTAVLRVLEEKDQVLAETESMLRFTEGRLNQVLDSRAWKIADSIQRIRLLLAPPESRRAQILSRALNAISHPLTKTRND
jgi:hypothetical protein